MHLLHWDAPDPRAGSAADIDQIFTTASLGAPGMALKHKKEKVREKHRIFQALFSSHGHDCTCKIAWF